MKRELTTNAEMLCGRAAASRSMPGRQQPTNDLALLPNG